MVSSQFLKFSEDEVNYDFLSITLNVEKLFSAKRKMKEFVALV